MSKGKAYRIVLSIGLPLAALTAVAGVILKSRALLWVVAGIGAVVALPVALVVALIAIFVAFLLAFLPFAPLISWLKSRAERRKLRSALSALDAVPSGDERGWSEAMETLRSIRPADKADVVSRVKTLGYPWRLSLLEFVSLKVLEELARNAADPLAPIAWLLALRERHHGSSQIREGVPAEEAEKLWRRALTTSDLLALPPELQVPPGTP